MKPEKSIRPSSSGSPTRNTVNLTASPKSTPRKKGVQVSIVRAVNYVEIEQDAELVLYIPEGKKATGGNAAGSKRARVG